MGREVALDTSQSPEYRNSAFDDAADGPGGIADAILKGAKPCPETMVWTLKA